MYQPNFTITNSILANIGLIEAAKALIDSSPLLPSWEKRFQDEAIVRSVHHGTHLEGNELEFSEAKRVIEGENIVARDRDIQEVINYRNVIEFIGSPNLNLNEALLKQLHKLTTEKLLPQEQIGKYRTSSVVIRNSRTGKISFRPPPAIEVPYQIRDFLTWLNNDKTTHPVIRAGISHYELVRIHPFIDGNGRVARATAMLVLYKEGYDIRRFFSLEEYYDKDSQRYYKALQSVLLHQKDADVRASPPPENLLRGSSKSVEKPGTKELGARSSPYQRSAGGEFETEENFIHKASFYDLTPWLEYFTEGLAIEFNRVKEKIAKISRDINLKSNLGGQIYLNDRQLKLIEHIQDYGYLQNKTFSRLFPDLSDDTILRELKELMKKNIIKKKGKTKAARYVLA